ncbi:3-demethylubiquinone-9 3-methyltransferase [Prosthecobacter fusiformis]|uniref:3-demethylubiquinone-9 3-methyltransferase n=1 Tax=Prosthecobacter fusiformis TaxID=48464 RepID=A0A4R7RK89_9BACT|nr:VOC family protein [Prosthecobacter fusiformis]TDU63162.1 3-demethylubiquinone-9 3-methyltransferase [Prosthecobacter fusiformis]
MTPTPKNIICLWFDKEAEDVARFYAATFPDNAVTVHFSFASRTLKALKELRLN